MENTSSGTNQEYAVKGTVRFADSSPATKLKLSAFDRDLRSEQALGQSQTDRQGLYEIQYSARQFLKAEKGNADLVVKAFAADGSLLAASPVLFNAPPSAEVDLTIPAEGDSHRRCLKKSGRRWRLARRLEGGGIGGRQTTSGFELPLRRNRL